MVIADDYFLIFSLSVLFVCCQSLQKWQLYKQTISRLEDFIEETRQKQNVRKGKEHANFLAGTGVAGKEILDRIFAFCKDVVLVFKY